MSTLRVSTIQDTAGSNSSTPAAIANGICKAWVNFNGSTGAIRASYNVSSVTRNGTGDYTINFASALADANYAAELTCNRDGNGYQIQIGFRSGGTFTASALQIHTSSDNNNNFVDASQVCVSIFR